MQCGGALAPYGPSAVFPHRGKSFLRGRLRPLWGRTGGEAARWGQAGVISRQTDCELMERVAERRTTSGVFEYVYRFDEARSLRAIVIRQP